MPIDPEHPIQHRPARRRLIALIGVSGAALLGGAAGARAQAAAAIASCVVRPQQTEGPFFVDEGLNRSDIRSDPKTGERKSGVPLRLAFRLSRLAGTSCAPLAGAQVDVWHSDAEGRYSDTGGFGFRASTGGQQFLQHSGVFGEIGVAVTKILVARP